MEEERIPVESAEEGYAPRPKWQVWAARIGLALFILTLIAYYLNVFRGGL